MPSKDEEEVVDEEEEQHSEGTPPSENHGTGTGTGTGTGGSEASDDRSGDDDRGGKMDQHEDLDVHDYDDLILNDETDGQGNDTTVMDKEFLAGSSSVGDGAMSKNPTSVVAATATAGKIAPGHSASSLDDGRLPAWTGEEVKKDGSLKRSPPITVLSSSSILERRVSVTADRKHELLMKARKDRTDWISLVPAPYRRHRGSRAAVAGAALQEDEDSSRDPVAWSQELERTHAVQLLPSSLDLLSHLYGIMPSAGSSPAPAPERKLPRLGGDSGTDDAAAAERINSIIAKAKCSSTKRDGALVSLSDQMQLELEGTADAVERSYLRSYRTLFFQSLFDPASAVVVQGMRNFCRKIVSVREPQELARRLESYLASTWDAALRSSRNSVRKPKTAPPRQAYDSSSSTGGTGGDGSGTGADTDSETIRHRSFEAFIYGQCYSHLESVLWTSEATRREQQWRARLGELQFVTPRHLEINCLRSEPDEGGLNIDLDELLKDASDALTSIDAYYSPRDKLRRILAVYHSVNAALMRALNLPQALSTNATTTSIPSSAPSKKLPSADDVLPTIILCVLRSQPRRLLWNLQFVEEFSSPEALRGEAGYAFTNLYGAAQFLLDLDLDVGEGDVNVSETSKSPSGLSISAEEFRRGLTACRDSARERTMRRGATSSASSPPSAREDTIDLLCSESMDISPRDVRAARNRDETVDVEWALRLQEEQRHRALDLHSGENPASGAPGRPRRPSLALPFDEAGEELPQGFARSYSFLTARPEDVRLSDLPRLLDEYRMLVHTTEALLSERAARARAERKAQRRTAERELYGRVREVDPSLLQLPPSSEVASKGAAVNATHKTLNGTR
jgi:hypothetical protein